jgi:outer membrane autotransporter protein
MLSGMIAGAAALTKAGTGTLILTGNSSGFSGTTTVVEGTLEVGSASTPTATLGGNVTVATSAALMGHGTIGGSVTNGGTVQPGGTIGVMTIAGNYTQSSAGTLTIEITPNAAAGAGIGYSQLRVGGSASLAGALSIIDDPGTYTVGSRYTILTTAGGRTGTFASVGYNLAFAAYITPDITYDANDVFLTLDPTPAPAAAPPPLFNGGQQVPDALTAVVSAVQGVGDAVLGDVCGPTAQRLVTQGQGCVVRSLAAGYRAEVWMRGLGGVGSLTGSGSRFSFSNSYAGALIGAGIGQGGFTVGLGGGYLMTALNFSDGSNASQNAGLGFIYGRYAQGPLWLGAMAAYGGGKVSAARSLPGTGLTASGSRGADFGIVQAQAAYDIPIGVVTFEPRASLAYTHAGQAGFSESGADILDLTYANTNTDVFEGRLVGRVMRRFVAGTWALVPYAEAGVQETFTGLLRGVTMTDGTFTGSAAGVSPAPTAGVVGVGVAAGMTEALDLFIDYQGQFSANQAENTFAAGVAYRF